MLAFFLDSHTSQYDLDDKKQLTWDMAEAMNLELRQLAASGCKVIQLEEPTLHFISCYYPEMTELIDFLVDCFNREIEGLDDVEIWIHTCWGNPNMQKVFSDESYANSVEIYLDRLKGDVWTIEATENDMKELPLFAPYKDSLKKKIAVGVVSHRTLQADFPEVVAGRVRRALEYIPADKLVLSTDCGFGRQGFNRHIAFYKSTAIPQGRNIVLEELGARASIRAGRRRAARLGLAPGLRAAHSREAASLAGCHARVGAMNGSHTWGSTTSSLTEKRLGRGLTRPGSARRARSPDRRRARIRSRYGCPRQAESPVVRRRGACVHRALRPAPVRGSRRSTRQRSSIGDTRLHFHAELWRCTGLHTRRRNDRRELDGPPDLETPVALFEPKRNRVRCRLFHASVGSRADDRRDSPAGSRLQGEYDLVVGSREGADTLLELPCEPIFEGPAVTAEPPLRRPREQCPHLEDVALACCLDEELQRGTRGGLDRRGRLRAGRHGQHVRLGTLGTLAVSDPRAPEQPATTRMNRSPAVATRKL